MLASLGLVLALAPAEATVVDDLAPEPVEDPETSEPETASAVPVPPPATDSGSKPSTAIPRPLPYDPAIDLPLTLVPGSYWLLTETLKRHVAPIRCRWCSVEGNDFDTGARDTLRWSNPKAAALTSDVVVYAAIPVAILGMELIAWSKHRQRRVLPADLAIIIEAVTVAAAFNQTAKLAAARQRPYAHFSPSPIPFSDNPDQNLGFYSGHASLGFSLVTAAGTVASMRGYRIAPAVWGVGMPLASFVTYLRVAGDRHYLSDTLVGAAMGGLIGFAMPFTMHHPDHGLARRRGRRPETTAQVGPFPGGASVTLRW